MSWYHDPDAVPPPQGVPAPHAPVPSGPVPPPLPAPPPLTPGPTVGPPTSMPPPPGGSPPGWPQMSTPGPGAPPAGAPAPSQPTGGMKAVVLVGAGLLLALVTVVAGFFAYRMVKAPEQMTDREYVRTLCREVIRPLQRQGDRLDSRYGDLWDDDDLPVSRATRLVADVKGYAGVMDDTANGIAGFDGSHRLRGRDGDDLHQAISEMHADWGDAYGTLHEDLDAVDPGDRQHVVKDLKAALDDAGESFQIHVSTDLLETLTEAANTDDCRNALRSILSD